MQKEQEQNSTTQFHWLPKTSYNISHIKLKEEVGTLSKGSNSETNQTAKTTAIKKIIIKADNKHPKALTETQSPKFQHPL